MQTAKMTGIAMIKSAEGDFGDLNIINMQKAKYMTINDIQKTLERNDMSLLAFGLFAADAESTSSP